MDERVDVLEVSECWRLLRTVPVGRVVGQTDGRLEIRPVNFAVDRGTVLIRTGPFSTVSGFAGESVAFETDGLYPGDGDVGSASAAWSVIVEGIAHTIHGTDALAETIEVPLAPWHGSPKPLFLRIEPSTVSGRSFPVVDPSVWTSVLAGARRVAAE